MRWYCRARGQVSPRGDSDFKKEWAMQDLQKSQRAMWTALGLEGALTLGLTASAAYAAPITNTLHGFCQATDGTQGPGTGCTRHLNPWWKQYLFQQSKPALTVWLY